jgi:hypothetical protein
MFKIKKTIAALTIAAAATAGVVIPQVTAPQSAQAATCTKKIVGYKTKNTVQCWFSPSNPACIVPIYSTNCGGKF